MKTLSVWDERRIPRDIRQYVKKRILRRVIPCVISIVLFLLVLLTYDSFFFGGPDKPFRAQSQVVAYAMAVIIPLAVTGVPIKLIDSSWEGEVIKVHAYTSLESKTSIVKNYSRDILLQLNIKLTVKTPQGKVIRKRAIKSHASQKGILNIYRTGDTVLHLYGTNHTVVLPKSTTDTVGCVICGRRNQGKTGRCECGYSLLR